MNSSKCLRLWVEKNSTLSGALFDETGAYRYRLWRAWNASAPIVTFILLNPSTADHTQNDPTIRSCIRFARHWQYGRLEVVNLFAYRTPYPALLRQVTEPIGKDTDRHLLEAVSRSDAVILAWGNGGQWLSRDRAVLSLLKDCDRLFCIDRNQNGTPRHPLYAKVCDRIPWRSK